MGAALLFVASFHVIVRELLTLVAAGFAVLSLDSLAIDISFAARATWRRLAVHSRWPRGRADRLSGPGARMAIVIPAWDEAAVIGPMLRALFTTLDYANYRVFVGVYPNDPPTLDEVRAVADPRLTIVTCRRPGPTTKADCLNHLWSAVLADERACGRAYTAIVLHDAEDVVDAYELRVFDHLIPRLAMAQLPVEPLPDADSPWVAGHYLDEFAEAHFKDVVMREAWGAAVPSAGVGCAIERGMLGRIADAAAGAPFDAACLTEDYELGIRIGALGGRTAMVRIARPGGGVVATRAYFPATLDAAVRQKTRWLLGIAFGGWDRLGWRGSAADRVMLMRDRKAIAAALLTVAGYAVAALALLDLGLVRWTGVQGLPPLVAEGGWLALALAFTTAVLGWRLIVRMLCTGHVYGWREGLSALPRVVTSNLINALSAWQALRRYTATAASGTAIWDKTLHKFPAS